MSNVDSQGNLISPFVPPQSHAGTPNRAPRQPNSDLDRNAFLNLLVTQLRHQDPLNPMDDREFIAQMAQFSALEQMQNLNTTMSNSASFNMIGQTIAGVSINPVTGARTEVLGRVEGVRVQNSEAWLIVGMGENERMIRASEVEYIFEDFWHRDTMNSIGNNVLANLNNNLVGRTIQAITQGSDGLVFVEGEVEYIDFTGGIPMLVVGNHRIPPGDLVIVSDENMIIGRSIGYYDNSVRAMGTIAEVRILNDTDAYLVINGELHAIDRINFVTEALRLYRTGADVNFGLMRGTISEVFIRNDAVWITIDRGADASGNRFETVSFESFMRRNTPGWSPEEPDGPTDEPTE